MVFSSSVFLLAFMPFFFLMYYLLPWRNVRNALVLAASLLFYAWGEPVYVLLMMVSIIVNWGTGILLGKSEGGRRKLLLVTCLAFNLLVLGFFKYESFLATNLNLLLGRNIVPEIKLPLPVGISFYTLQAVSYVIDVYRREVEPQPNPALLGMYIAMFPQLVAGPIVRYADVEQQILHREESLNKVVSGLRLFIIGLAKKVLLANIVGALATQMISRGGEAIGAVGAWGGLAAYTFQILFDFSGYSDMAIGLGRMLGFDFPRNFYYPYISTSVTEFWRRWHMSLSSFFRDYIYIPLGGNRVSRIRWILNLSAVWLLTGVWHGAAWNYILWGLYYLMLLILEKLVWGEALSKAPTPIRHIYAIIAFSFGWLLFWCEDLSILPSYLAALFGVFGPTGASTPWELQVWSYLPIFGLCAISSTPIVPRVRDAIVSRLGGQPRLEDARSTQALCDYDAGMISLVPIEKRSVASLILLLVDALLIALLVCSMSSVISGSFNPFIYFRF